MCTSCLTYTALFNICTPCTTYTGLGSVCTPCTTYTVLCSVYTPWTTHTFCVECAYHVLGTLIKVVCTHHTLLTLVWVVINLLVIKNTTVMNITDNRWIQNVVIWNMSSRCAQISCAEDATGHLDINMKMRICKIIYQTLWGSFQINLTDFNFCLIKIHQTRAFWRKSKRLPCCMSALMYI